MSLRGDGLKHKFHMSSTGASLTSSSTKKVLIEKEQSGLRTKFQLFNFGISWKPIGNLIFGDFNQI